MAKKKTRKESTSWMHNDRVAGGSVRGARLLCEAHQVLGPFVSDYNRTGGSSRKGNRKKPTRFCIPLELPYGEGTGYIGGEAPCCAWALRCERSLFFAFFFSGTGGAYFPSCHAEIIRRKMLFLERFPIRHIWSEIFPFMTGNREDILLLV